MSVVSMCWLASFSVCVFAYCFQQLRDVLPRLGCSGNHFVINIWSYDRAASISAAIHEVRMVGGKGAVASLVSEALMNDWSSHYVIDIPICFAEEVHILRCFFEYRIY
jgi:hypothetical protein